MCHIPHWMMKSLGIEEGDPVNLSAINLSKGTSVKLRPHDPASVDFSGHLDSLSNGVKNYAVLCSGDTINIQLDGRDCAFDVQDCQPDEKISTIEADLSIELVMPQESTQA